jgi:thiol-disulfide isomerase/thioredoxin
MKDKFWKGFWVGVLSCIGLAILGTFGFYKYAEHLVAKRLKAPEVPAELKENYDFKYTTLDGENRRLSELRGKVVFVNFWGTWCLPCVAEMPTVQKLYDHFKGDSGVVFIIASRQDAPDKIRSFAKKHSYDLPFYTLKDEDIPLAMRLNQYPATFIYTKDGGIAMKHINGADWSDPAVIAFIKKLEAQ